MDITNCILYFYVNAKSKLPNSTLVIQLSKGYINVIEINEYNNLTCR